MAYVVIRTRIFKMSINPKTGEVNLLVQLHPTDRASRNGLHRAMKHGDAVALAVECEDEGRVYEAGRDYRDLLLPLQLPVGQGYREG